MFITQPQKVHVPLYYDLQWMNASVNDEVARPRAKSSGTNAEQTRYAEHLPHLLHSWGVVGDIVTSSRARISDHHVNHDRPHITSKELEIEHVLFRFYLGTSRKHNNIRLNLGTPIRRILHWTTLGRYYTHTRNPETAGVWQSSWQSLSTSPHPGKRAI